MNPIGLQNIGWRYYIVYVAILAVESFIAYSWFIETKGKALEEIAVLFDKEQAEIIPIELAKEHNMTKDHNVELSIEEREENVARKV